MAWWADRVTKRFWGESDPEAAGKGSAVVFAVACTVASVAGYLVQQFLVGTGIALAFSKVSAFSKLTDMMQGAKKALKASAQKAAKVAKGAAKRITRGTAEAADGFLKKIGLKQVDDAFEAVARCVARLGAANSCHLNRLLDIQGISKKFVDDLHVAYAKLDDALQAHVDGIIDDLVETGVDAHRAGDIGELKWIEKHADDLVDIHRRLPDGSIPDFITKIDGIDTITELKNYPGFNDMPQFLKDKLLDEDIARYGRYAGHGPTKLVYATPMPQRYIDDLVKAGVPLENIINGL
jgi:hypothetical protein